MIVYDANGVKISVSPDGSASVYDAAGNRVAFIFTSTLPGAVPASGGGTSNFLRADGTWNAPAGGSGLTHPQVLARTMGA